MFYKCHQIDRLSCPYHSWNQGNVCNLQAWVEWTSVSVTLRPSCDNKNKKYWLWWWWQYITLVFFQLLPSEKEKQQYQTKLIWIKRQFNRTHNGSLRWKLGNVVHCSVSTRLAVCCSVKDSKQTGDFHQESQTLKPWRRLTLSDSPVRKSFFSCHNDVYLLPRKQEVYSTDRRKLDGIDYGSSLQGILCFN